jgi:transcriptional regulator GlxA family with amidase domain
VLLPGYSPLAVAATLEALEATNELLEGTHHEAVLLSVDGLPVAGSSGVSWPGTAAAVPAALASQPGPLRSVQVHADPGLLPAATTEPLAAWLRGQARQGAVLAGIGTGAAVLAQAGLLDGHRATLPSAFLRELADAHPRVVFSAHLYEIDGTRLSCAAGTACLDLMVAWLGQLHGERCTQALLAHFGLERLRARDERQREPLGGRGVTGSPKLAEAVALMEANLGEPLPTEDIARLVGVSRRQLERLFKQHLGELPSRYYGELRLARAQRLLRQSSQSVLQVGLACGFTSGSHFSNAYRARFGRTPREERSPMLGAAVRPPPSRPPEPEDPTA